MCGNSDQGSSKGRASEQARQTSGPTSPGVVLVVDDERGIRDLISDVLRRRGYTVEVCPGGAEAIGRIKAGDVRLLFLDIRMSGMNGVEVLETIAEEHPDIRVAMITGFASEELEERVRALSPLALLRKPFGLREIIQTAEQALARVSSEEA